MPRLTEWRIGDLDPGANYRDDEIEFMLAMDRYKRIAQRPFPMWHEVLRVLKELGYRKVVVETREPRPHSE